MPSTPRPHVRPDGHAHQSPRERLRRAYDDLHPASIWRGAVLTARLALEETGQGRIRALFWVHDALLELLPDDAGDDGLEQRVLRRAVAAIEDEIVADHATALLAA